MPAAAKPLYEIASKHNNERIKSYLAATLGLICMYAERWEDACKYAEESLKCNPRQWDDRAYNYACIRAARFHAMKSDADRQEAVRLLEEFFTPKGEQNLTREIKKALDDEDLLPIKPDIRTIALRRDKGYAIARIYALAFEREQNLRHKEEAIALMKGYFDWGGELSVNEKILLASQERDLLSIKTEIEAMASQYDNIRP